MKRQLCKHRCRHIYWAQELPKANMWCELSWYRMCVMFLVQSLMKTCRTKVSRFCLAKKQSAAALVSYSWLAFFKLISLVAISHTSYASFNEILQPTSSYITWQLQWLTLFANWKGSPMNIPLRPFCLKLAGGVAERHTKDHTRFPHPQAALEHFNDIAWYRNAFHCHKDLGVGNPRKVT